MKKKKYIKLLSVAMSLVILCGLFSPAMVSATSSNTYTSGLQKFLDDGNHTQLVDCPDAVYMEYAEQLRNDPDASFAMSLLSFIYGEKSEPTKDQYKQALLNVIKTYEEENADALTQQNLMDDTKELKDYLQDIVDLEMGWLGVIGAAEAMGEDASLALSVINEMSKDEGDWAKGVSALKTTLQNYEKYDTFLLLIENKSDDNLKKAATELRTALSEVMMTRLRAYKDLAADSAEDYAKLFIDEIFSEDWLNFIEKKGNIHIADISLFKACQAAKLGAEIGKLLGNLLVGAEDVITYVIEIKAVHDISVILETELDSIKNTFQKDNTKVTEIDTQNYIAYGNYLISSRVRGQYCMTAIYMQCSSLRTLLGESAAKNAESLYNRLTNNLLSIKKKLDAIIDVNEDPSISPSQLCLSELEPILSEHYEGNEGDSRFFILEGEEYRNGNISVNGEHYQNGYEVWIARWNYTEEISWVRNIYDLDGKCTELSGKTGLIAGSYNSDNFNTTLYFYGDGRLLTSIVLTDEDYQHEFQIDVSNIHELEIFVQDNVAVRGGTSFALFDLFLTGDISNSTVPPSPSEAFSWEFDETTGTVTISGTGSMKDYHCDHDPAPWDELGYDDLLKHMVIKDGITEIGTFTFAFVDETVTIPKSVTKIRSGAFADAWNLQTVYYQGTESEWNNIAIDYAGNGELERVNIIYLGNSN